ncbi:MAG TPA: hypothetical protein VN924_30595 [Bryobacteraceae bacterium]|jgi:hypothetical protein|nr:hypothetical protein [Bryobacteraceae bacterium]
MDAATLVPPNPKNSGEWLLLFAGLTLDLVKPYRNQLGLQLPENVVAFEEGLRKAFIETSEESALPQALLTWMFETYGEAFLLHLAQWKASVFKPDDAQSFQAYVWRLLVTRGGLSGQRDVETPPPFVVSVRFALAMFPSSPIPRMPQSPWDRALFERLGYQDDFSPMTYFTAAVRHWRFVTAWEAALHSKVLYDAAEMKAWAEREAEVRKMPIEQVKDPVWLPLPAPWR